MSSITDGTAKFNLEFNPPIPTGSIMPFHGSFNTSGNPIDSKTGVVYTTWHICDGTNGTVDLRGRFVLGASSTYAVGSTGGEASHTLSVAELPKFTPAGTIDTVSLTGNLGSTYGGRIWFGWDLADGIISKANAHDNTIIPQNNGTYTNYGTIHIDASHSHTFTGTQIGGGAAHNNMPPYYALSFIEKI